MLFFQYCAHLLADLVRCSMVWKCFIIINSFITLIPCVKIFNRGK